jgi:hypothetical protein
VEVIGTKALRVFTLAIHSHYLYYGFYSPPPPPLRKIGLKLACNCETETSSLRTSKKLYVHEFSFRYDQAYNILSPPTLWARRVAVL